MQTEDIPIAELSLDPANARVHPDKNLDAIKGSLKRFGQQKPVVVDENGVVIAGNGTVEAAKALGWDTISVVKSELKGSDRTAYALADNRSQDLSQWDDEALGSQLQALYEDDYDIGDIGFEPADYEWSKDAQTDEKEDEVPNTEENEFGVERGQIWRLGEHRVMCGDSTDKADVERLMNGEKADMVFTDPPYGMALDFNQEHSDLRKGKFSPVIGDDAPFDPSPILKIETKRHCIWGADWFYRRMEAGFSPIVWDKQPANGQAGQQNHFELCWVRPAEKRRIIRRLWTGFTAKEKGEARVHPTQKPVEVCEDIMERGGKSVLDLFLGSGSTLIACEKTNRKCYGMEIDPHYVSVIIKRWQEYTGREAVRVEQIEN